MPQPITDLDLYHLAIGKIDHKHKALLLQAISDDEQLLQRYTEIKNQYVLAQVSLQSQLPPSFFTKKKTSLTNRFIAISTSIAAIVSLVVLFNIDGLIPTPSATKNEIVSSNQPSSIEYLTNRGVKGIATLPDGSRVILNSDSYIKVPAHFTKNKREIEFYGEGFFDIKHDPTSPMVIHTTNQVQVVVKGTQFNLEAHKSAKEVSAYLVKGAIDIVPKKQKTVQVDVKQKVTLDFKKRVTHKVEPKESLPTIGWKDGWLIFNNVPLQEAFTKIARWHGVEFICNNEKILAEKFTGKFKEESVQQILDIMKTTNNIDYQINEKQISIH